MMKQSGDQPEDENEQNQVEDNIDEELDENYLPTNNDVEQTVLEKPVVPAHIRNDPKKYYEYMTKVFKSNLTKVYTQERAAFTSPLR